MKKKFDFNFNKENASEQKVSRKQFRNKTNHDEESTKTPPETTIYVGNLSYTRNEESIKELFSPFGYVKSVSIVLRPGTNLKSGIAFVKMTNEEKALTAIKELNGKLVDERTLKVSIANSRF